VGLNTDVTLLQSFFVEAMSKGMNGLFSLFPPSESPRAVTPHSFITQDRRCHRLDAGHRAPHPISILVRSWFDAAAEVPAIDSPSWNVVIGNDAKPNKSRGIDSCSIRLRKTEYCLRSFRICFPVAGGGTGGRDEDVISPQRP
jgi:hypothetical protein